MHSYSSKISYNLTTFGWSSWEIMSTSVCKAISSSSSNDSLLKMIIYSWGFYGSRIIITYGLFLWLLSAQSSCLLRCLQWKMNPYMIVFKYFARFNIFNFNLPSKFLLHFIIVLYFLSFAISRHLYHNNLNCNLFQ